MKVNLRASVQVALVWAAGILLLAPSGAAAQHIVDSIQLPCPVELPVGKPSMAVNARDHVLYYGTDESEVLLAIDERRGAVLFTVELHDCLTALCYNPKYNRLYCTVSDEEAIVVLDGTTAQLLNAVALTDVPTALVLDSTLDRLYALCWDGNIAAIDCAGEQVLSVVEVGEWFQTPVVEYAPGIGRIFCSDEYLDSIYFYDCASGSAAGGAELESEPGCLCYNPANGLLYVSLLGEAILLVVDPVAGLVVDSIEVAGDWGRIRCDPRSNRVYGGSNDWLYAIDGACNRVTDSVRIDDSFSVLAYSARHDHIYTGSPAG